MFRRLANRVSDAVNSATSSNATDSSSDARVSELAAMGFREAEARQALRQANGDMTQATEWLLINGSPVGITANPIAISETSTEDAELQRAIQASLAIEKKKPRHQSAASKHAGQAASARLSQPTTKKTLATTHPKVQMPKRLSQHDQEDVILRCANRVAPHSLSVDTLLRSLKTIQGNPSNRKYHTVDTSSAGFQRSLKAPGVLDFLKAVNFHPEYQNNKKLTMSHYDAAAFYLGISALEQIQNTNNEYTKDKALRIFQSELTTALKESSEQELKARNQFLSLLPTEPKKGGSQITIEYGVILNHANNTEVTKILRNFDHDDTLGDVLNWLGGQSSVLKQKLESGDWKLVDRNRQGKESTYGFHELDLQDLQHRSLQYAGCWPSGRLAVVPKLELWF